MSTMINTASVVSAGGPSKGLTKLNEIDMADDSCKKLYAKGYFREEVTQTLKEAFTLLSDVDIERTVKSVFDAPKEAPVSRKSPSRQKSVSRQQEASSGEDESEEEAPVSRQAPVSRKKTASRKAVVEDEDFELLEDKLPRALAIMKSNPDDAQAINAMLTKAFQTNKPNKKTGVTLPYIVDWKDKIAETAAKRAAHPKSFEGSVDVAYGLVEDYCDRPGLENTPDFEKSMDRWLTYARSVDPETFAKYLKGHTTHKYSPAVLAAAFAKLVPGEARLKVEATTDHAKSIAYMLWFSVRTIFHQKVV